MVQKMFPLSHPTREDKKIQKHPEKMGVIFLRKKAECLGSGSIVNVEGSKLFPKSKKIKWCLLTSDIYFPDEDIFVEDYFFEFWISDLKTVHKLSLRDVAQSKKVYRTTPGLALIPVCPSKFEKLLTSMDVKSSVLDKRRTFRTIYHYGEVESGSRNEIKKCFIVGSYECKKESLKMEPFTLIRKKDDQGKLRNELQDVNGDTFQSYNQIRAGRPHLYPYGAAILEGDGPQATCVGILNFTKEDDGGLISPVFFTPETLTAKVQLYYPSVVEEKAVSGCADGRMEPTTSQIDSAIHSKDSPSSTRAPSEAPDVIVTSYENHPLKFSSVEPGNQVGASLTNEDQAVYPDDYTLQAWQKLCEKLEDENTKLKKQSELYDEVRDENTKLKQQSERDGKKNYVRKERFNELRMDIKRTEQENEELRAQIDHLYRKNEHLSLRLKDERKSWDAEREELLVENRELRKSREEERKELLVENEQLRKEGNAERKKLLAVIKKLRAEKKDLKTKYEELCTAYEELYARHKEETNQLGDLLSQPNSALFGDDTSSIKDSNDAKAEGPSGTSANSPQEESDGSCKEGETFLDPLSEDASELE